MSSDDRFPVEILNSFMCILQIYSILKNKESYFNTLKSFKLFFASKEDDFEVKINNHLHDFCIEATKFEHLQKMMGDFLPMFAR